ncbi:MAG: zf-TFIIB domain-containing protein [Kofleriaceae bacterium]
MPRLPRTLRRHRPGARPPGLLSVRHRVRAAGAERPGRAARVPRCGAGVPEDHATCDHCAAALLVKSCPRCLAHVFHGHQHCPKCGAGVATAAALLDAASATYGCPRCEVALMPRLLGDLQVDECPRCVGVFVDAVAIERILAERQQARADALLGAYLSAPAPAPQAGKLYVSARAASR